MNKRQLVPIVQGDLATRLTSASRKPLSDTQVEAVIKARLKAEDAATMQRPAKGGPATKMRRYARTSMRTPCDQRPLCTPLPSS